MWLNLKLWLEEWWILMYNWYRLKKINYLMWKLDRLMKKHIVVEGDFKVSEEQESSNESKQ